MPQQRDLAREGLIVAWLSPGHVHHWFAESLLQLRESGLWGGGRIALVSGPRIAEARSQVFDAFLRMDDKPEWILLVDSDMSFPPEALADVRAAASRTNAQVVGGLCYAGGHSAIVPTLYEAVELDGGTPAPRLVEPDRARKLIEARRPVKVAATGAAFLLVHRKVVERMKLRAPAGFGSMQNGERNPYPWFAEGIQVEGNALGEDVVFTWRAHCLGFGVYVHTGVEIDHWKERPLNTELYLETGDRIAARSLSRERVA